MVDTKVASKHRDRVNKLVAERLGASPGKDEAQVRREVNKELRDQKKKNKMKVNKEEIEKIKKNVVEQMGDSDPKSLQKAISKATSRYYSQQKKAKSESVNQKCDKILQQHVSEKWYPKKCSWFDKKCQKHFEDIQLLGAMMDINILKNPGPMEKIFPDECKAYFDLLARKRFKRTKVDKDGEQAESNSEGAKKKKPKAKSAITKKVQEKLAASDGTKSEMELLKEVVAEVKDVEKKKILKQLRKSWKPSQKPWFDKDCKAAYKSIVEKGAENGLSIGEVASDYKTFKIKFKTESKAYFNLLAEKKKAFDTADKQKRDATKNEI